ncbi:ABC transporter substrate-binding protein [Desulfovibrio sp. OttesenSCG-928-O18]|nr:ABC transporter substrate-binding protein [Desulfovibrio sp. OttesenSCG-928-O18]
MMKRLSLFLAALLLVMFTATGAVAAKSATDTIRQTIDNVLDIIKRPGMHDQAQRGALLKEVEEQIKTIFDFTEFSARTVGPKWRQFSADQKNRFIEAFSELLRVTYVEKLETYDGEKVKFTGEISSTKGDKVEVQTMVLLKDKEVPVCYRLLTKNDEWKVYDVRIEKVSLIENYKGQFKEILLKGDADSLIKKVEEKAAEVRQQNSTAKPS